MPFLNYVLSCKKQQSSLLLLEFLTVFYSVTHLKRHAFIYGWFTLIDASMSPHIWLRVVLECLGNLCIVCPLFLSQVHANAGKSAVEKKAGACSQPWSIRSAFQVLLWARWAELCPSSSYFPPKHARRQTEEIKTSTDTYCERGWKKRPVYCCTRAGQYREKLCWRTWGRNSAMDVAFYFPRTPLCADPGSYQQALLDMSAPVSLHTCLVW